VNKYFFLLYDPSVSLHDRYRKKGSFSDLLQGQLGELGQGAGQQAHDERGRSADDVQHGRGQHGDVGVLPHKGVEQRHDGVAALGESAAGTDTGRRSGGWRSDALSN